MSWLAVVRLFQKHDKQECTQKRIFRLILTNWPRILQLQEQVDWEMTKITIKEGDSKNFLENLDTLSKMVLDT